jgi:signal transduction histidine kinase
LANAARMTLRVRLKARRVLRFAAMGAVALAVASEALAVRAAPTIRARALGLAAALTLSALVVEARNRADLTARRLVGSRTRGSRANGAERDAGRRSAPAPRVVHQALVDALTRIVHELRQPFGAASNALATAGLVATTPELAHELHDLATRELGSGLAGLEALARYARIGVGERVRIDAIDAVTIALGPHVDTVELDADYDGVVEIDPSQFGTALSALVQNALDACPDGPIRVEARGEESGTSLIVRIIDSGAEPNGEALARASEPFFTTRAGRLGLGSSMAAAFARAMGGYLEARREGPYTIVALAIPAVPSEPLRTSP